MKKNRNFAARISSLPGNIADPPAGNSSAFIYGIFGLSKLPKHKFFVFDKIKPPCFRSHGRNCFERGQNRVFNFGTYIFSSQSDVVAYREVLRTTEDRVQLDTGFTHMRAR